MISLAWSLHGTVFIAVTIKHSRLSSSPSATTEVDHRAWLEKPWKSSTALLQVCYQH